MKHENEKEKDSLLKPDFLDLDGDGNKEEPMKKAAQDKEEMREPKVFGGITRALSKGAKSLFSKEKPKIDNPKVQKELKLVDNEIKDIQEDLASYSPDNIPDNVLEKNNLKIAKLNYKGQQLLKSEKDLLKEYNNLQDEIMELRLDLEDRNMERGLLGQLKDAPDRNTDLMEDKLFDKESMLEVINEILGLFKREPKADGDLVKQMKKEDAKMAELYREQKEEGGEMKMLPDEQMEEQLKVLYSIYDSDFEKLNQKERVLLEDQIERLRHSIQLEEVDRVNKSEGGEMVPDEKMEEQFVDFVIDEALSDKEESMLMEQLEANPELSMIFDKVIEKASEFTGAGEVEGPGTGVSDSIPARLSDGEFVFTANAVKEIGVENLEKMMKDAEDAYKRKNMQSGGEVEEEIASEPEVQEIRVRKETVGPQASMQEEKDLVADEIKKRMMLDPNQQHVRS